MKPAEEIPAFRPGDTVDVNVKIQEGNNSRIQTFTGVVIARKVLVFARPSSSARSALALVWSVASRCTPRPSTPSSSCVVAAFVAPSCTTCALCAVRPLVSSSAATTLPSESSHRFDRAADIRFTQINREIQRRNRSGFRAVFVFARV